MSKNKDITLKKQLKLEIKLLREEITKYNGIIPHCNLTTASIEQLQINLEECKQKIIELVRDIEIEENKEEIEEIEEINETEESLIVFNAKKLSELGKEIIQKLSNTGKYKGWYFSYWSKNGECRIYAEDHNYINPKKRGFYVIHNNGTYSKHNKFLPNLPELPDVENDLVAKSISAYDLAVRNLNRYYGVNGWDARDLEDELEREDYRHLT